MVKQQQQREGGSTTAALAGFVAGSIVTAAVAYAFSSKRQTQNKNDNHNVTTAPSSTTSTTTATTTTTTTTTKLPPSIRSEQMSRNSLYFSPTNLSTITSSAILVVGLGGVGSHAAHMLARGGAHYLRLIDFDQVTLSSLNRHACATLQDVGIPKVIAMKQFLTKICPDTTYLDIDARVQMYTGEPTKDGTLLDLPPHLSNRKKKKKKWDVVIDAIDDVPTKAKLLHWCVQTNTRVISCMGAGGKSDMTRLHISDLKTASRDPLATKLRQALKRLVKQQQQQQQQNTTTSTTSTTTTTMEKATAFMEDVDKLAVLYSSEKTVVKLADFTEEQKEEGVHTFGAVDKMRIRVLPVLGTMPAIMGQGLAALALCELGGKTFSPVAGERVGRNVRHRLFQQFKTREKNIRDKLEAQLASQNGTNENNNNNEQTNTTNNDKNQNNNNNTDKVSTSKIISGKWVGSVQIDIDDVEYLLAEVWRNRCAVTGSRLGEVLKIVRWDMSKPSDCTNLVLLGVAALQKYDEEMENGGGDGRDSVPEEIRRRIDGRLATCRVDSMA